MYMNEQKKLFRMIQDVSFAVYEAVLYLDGHPSNRQALEYYNKYNSKLAELTDIYESKYGPLTFKGNGCTDKWKWVDTPWPWEYESV